MEINAFSTNSLFAQKQGMVGSEQGMLTPKQDNAVESTFDAPRRVLTCCAANITVIILRTTNAVSIYDVTGPLGVMPREGAISRNRQASEKSKSPNDYWIARLRAR